MSTGLKTILQRTFNAVGVSVIKTSAYDIYRQRLHDQERCLPKFLEAIDEMEAAARELLFPDLPRKAGRNQLMAALLGTQKWEAFYLLGYLHRALSVEGDVCELGTAQGYTSALIASEILESGKRLNLFDSFQGLSKPTKEDQLIDDVFSLGSMDKYEGTMAFPKEQVLNQVRRTGFPMDRVKVYEGFIEQSIGRTDLPERVCFAYIDFDLYLPIHQALEMLESRVPPGGVLMVDDYDFLSAGVKKAVDEFTDARPGKFEVIKPRPFAGHFIILQKN
jgi:predicted O-methyltransferase YrrM